MTEPTATTAPRTSREQEIRLELIRPKPDQPRDYFDPEHISNLARSMAEVGQINPILVIDLGETDADGAQFQIYEGECRWRAMHELGGMAIRAYVTYDVASAEQTFEWSVAANFCRQGHTPMEIARAVERLKSSGKTNKQIAAIFGRSEPWVGQYHRLMKLDSSIVWRLEPGASDEEQITVQVAQLLAPLSYEDQRAYAPDVAGKGGLKKARKVLDEAGFKPNRKRSSNRSLSASQSSWDELMALANNLEDMLKRYDGAKRRRLREGIQHMGSEDLNILRDMLDSHSENLVKLIEMVSEVCAENSRANS